MLFIEKGENWQRSRFGRRKQQESAVEFWGKGELDVEANGHQLL